MNIFDIMSRPRNLFGGGKRINIIVGSMRQILIYKKALHLKNKMAFTLRTDNTHMCRNITIWRESNTVSAHLHDNVLTKYNNFLCTELYTAWITAESRGGYPSAKIFCNGVWNCRPDKGTKWNKLKPFIEDHDGTALWAPWKQVKQWFKRWTFSIF